MSEKKDFEEQFPGLKDKYLNDFEIVTSPQSGKNWIRMCLGKSKECLELKRYNTLFELNNIQKHCLDKQRVRDVIDKVIKKLELYPYKQMNGLEEEAKDFIKKEFKKELNLE